MNPDLERLVQLQRAETDLKRVEGELAEIPRQKALLDERLAEERGRLDAVREALAASQKARRQLEGELQDLETKRSKYKGQLMDVKTNKEYTAMLHEIESVEREIRGREDLILGGDGEGREPTPPTSSARKPRSRKWRPATARKGALSRPGPMP